MVKLSPSHRPKTTESRVLRVGEANLAARAFVSFSIARSHHRFSPRESPQTLRFAENDRPQAAPAPDMGQDRRVSLSATESIRTNGTRIRVFVLLPLVFLVGAALLWWMVVPGNPLETAQIIATCLSWLALIAAVGLLRHVPRRRVGAVIIAGTVLLGLVAVSAPPRTSNDSARYAWDGIVQKAGISPYSYVPIDETLSSLRPGWLFAPGSAGPDGKPVCAPDLF